MKNIVGLTSKIIISVLLLTACATASGISVDAGLTPPEGRWITRVQTRYMPSKDNDNVGNEMKMYGFPVMVAYGARNYLMVLARQTFFSRDMTMMGNNSTHSGFGDLFLMAKYKAYRLNTPRYIIGISPTLGISIPTGDDEFTSDSWDLNAGVYISGRRGRLASDLNFAYRWYDFLNRADNTVKPGNEIFVDWAAAYQLSLDREKSFTPVMEISLNKVFKGKINSAENPNSGGDILYLSPGAKLTVSSMIIEGLIRIPVSENRNGSQTEAETGFIAGLRMMF